MAESAIEVIRAFVLVLGTGGVLIATGALISARRQRQRGEAGADHPEKTDPERQR